MNPANPSEMIQPDVFGAEILRCGTKSGMDAVQHLGGGIADPDNSRACIVTDRLRNQPGGICEIDQPCAWTQSLYRSRLLDSDRNRAQRHRASARSSGLLPGITMLDCSPLVMRARFDAAHSNAVHHECSAIDRIFKRGSHANAEITTLAGNNGPAQLGHDTDAVAVGIKEDQLLRAQMFAGFIET